ncbi:MAG: glycosyltransferase family 61 protein [Pseudomonadota bacterium]
MQFQYFGLDQKSEKTNLFPEFEAQIKLPLNCKKDPFNLPPVQTIRAMDLLKFRNVFVGWQGIIFKGLRYSDESLFHDDVKNIYQKPAAKFKFFKRNYLQYKTIRVKKAVLAFDPWSQLNYFHWFCDTMMRVAATAPIAPADAVFILPFDKYSLKSTIILDSLRAFGIDESRILKMEKNQKIKVDELLMPSHQAQYGQVYFRDNLLNLIVGKIKNFYRADLDFSLGEKIYISRAKAATRKISNENELINLLKKYGFNVVNMEDFSLKQQIAIAHNARYLASCHGAGLTNILFMQKNGFVIEMINENMDRPHFYSLASAVGANYLIRKCRQSLAGKYQDNADIFVDIAALEEDLKTIIS